jgi:hypothetical protein
MASNSAPLYFLYELDQDNINDVKRITWRSKNKDGSEGRINVSLTQGARVFLTPFDRYPKDVRIALDPGRPLTEDGEPTGTPQRPYSRAGFYICRYEARVSDYGNLEFTPFQILKLEYLGTDLPAARAKAFLRSGGSPEQIRSMLEQVNKPAASTPDPVSEDEQTDVSDAAYV